MRKSFHGTKIKCEVVNKLCMASNVARRKGEHQYYRLQVVSEVTKYKGYSMCYRLQMVKEFGPLPASRQQRGNLCWQSRAWIPGYSLPTSKSWHGNSNTI